MSNHPLMTRIPRELFEQASIKCLSEHVSLALVVRELLILWVEGRIPFKDGYLKSRSVVGRKKEPENGRTNLTAGDHDR